LLLFFARYLCEVHLTRREMVARLQRPEVTAAQQFIEQHCTQRLTLARVAAAVGLSPAHFSAVFHRETKMTFTRYVQHRRAAQAARLLRDRQRRVTDICFACGFNSLTHLNRVFRKFHGCAPMQYRRRLRENDALYALDGPGLTGATGHAVLGLGRASGKRSRVRQ
jgi:AraC-like DNA-binding protein